MATLLELAPGWTLGVQRGPDWLIVKLSGAGANGWDGPSLAERLWGLLEQNFTYRLVLDLSDVPLLSSSLLGQLVMLNRRIARHQGVLRLCGLPEQHRETLRLARLDGALPYYDSARQAVQGDAPAKPR